MITDDDASVMVVRVKAWRFGVRLADVDRVVPAAMPVALPSAPDGALAIHLHDGVVPIVFGAALFGAEAVELHPSDKMVVLASPSGRTVLWVDAVEDVVPFAPLPPGAVPFAHEWVGALSGGDETLAVLDAEHLHRVARA